MRTQWVDWEEAWRDALYGSSGFVHTGEAPVLHFRTSVHVGTVLADALAELLDRTDHALGRPQVLDLVDLGAGGGELLSAMVDIAGAPLRRRLRPSAVDLRPAPTQWQLPWLAQLPERVTGLVIAHEWLDAIPCPVVQHDGNDARRMQVSADGTERLGVALSGPGLAWLRRWWPLADGERAEVGLHRDRAWQQVLRHMDAGAALAVDYGHLRTERPCAGTLAAYRHGRQVRPVPDASCDLTAHVSLDSLAALAPGVHTTQAEALDNLGAREQPQLGSWLGQAVRTGQIAELTDPAGFGGFGWVLHPTNIDLPL